MGVWVSGNVYDNLCVASIRIRIFMVCTCVLTLAGLNVHIVRGMQVFCMWIWACIKISICVLHVGVHYTHICGYI